MSAKKKRKKRVGQRESERRKKVRPTQRKPDKKVKRKRLPKPEKKYHPTRRRAPQGPRLTPELAAAFGTFHQAYAAHVKRAAAEVRPKPKVRPTVKKPGKRPSKKPRRATGVKSELAWSMATFHRLYAAHIEARAEAKERILGVRKELINGIHGRERAHWTVLNAMVKDSDWRYVAYMANAEAEGMNEREAKDLWFSPE